MTMMADVLKKLVAVFVILQLLFLGAVSYLYGSAFQSGTRVHNFNLLAVNLDNGIVGQSLEAAYSQLKGPSFPTLHFVSDIYNDAAAIREAVVNGNYWAAIYTDKGASERLLNALNSTSPEVASQYDASKAITYVWNEVRYPAYAESMFLSSFQALVQATRIAFNHLYAETLFKSRVNLNQGSLQVMLNPVNATGINIQPTTQGTRNFYNSVTIAMVVLQQFFFVLGSNILTEATPGFYTQNSRTRIAIIRFGHGTLFALIAALCMAGYIWAFRENWNVNGNQFVLTWMALWLLMQINNLLLFALTCWIPLPGMPLFMICWVLLNVASTATPFNLSPAFYHWGYALPAYETYQLLTDIWSRGSVPVLFRSLPILFTWLVVTAVLALFGLRHKYGVMQKRAMKADDVSPPDTKAAQPSV